MADEELDRIEDHTEGLADIYGDAKNKIDDANKKELETAEEHQKKLADLEDREAKRKQDHIERLADINGDAKDKIDDANKKELETDEEHQKDILKINQDYADKQLKVETDLADAQKSVFSTLIDFYIEELKRFAVAKAAAFTAEKIGDMITGSLFGDEGGGEGGGVLGKILEGVGGTAAAGGTATGGAAVASGGAATGGATTVSAVVAPLAAPLLAIAGGVTILYKNYKLVAESNDRLYDKLSEMAKNDEELAAHLTKFERGDKITGLENFQDRFGGFGVPDLHDMPKVDLNFNFDNLYNSALAGPQLSDIPQLSPDEITAIFKDAGLIPDTPVSPVSTPVDPIIDPMIHQWALDQKNLESSERLYDKLSEMAETNEKLAEHLIEFERGDKITGLKDFLGITGEDGETPILALSEETIEMLKPEPAVNLLEQSQSQPLRTTTADEVVQVKVMNESLMIEPKAGTTMPVTLGGEPVLIRSDGSAIPIIFQGSLHASLDIDAEALYISLQDAGVAAERDGL